MMPSVTRRTQSACAGAARQTNAVKYAVIFNVCSFTALGILGTGITPVHT
jgi:hypothetical protein